MEIIAINPTLLKQEPGYKGEWDQYLVDNVGQHGQTVPIMVSFDYVVLGKKSAVLRDSCLKAGIVYVQCVRLAVDYKQWVAESLGYKFV